MNSRLLQTLSLGIILAFPFAILLGVFPLAVYTVNHTEFQDDIRILNPFLRAGLWAGLVCFGAAFLLSPFPRVARILGLAALWLGLAFLLGDAVAPVQADALLGVEGKESILPVPARRALLEIALIALTFALLWWRREQALRLGPVFAVCVLAISAWSFWSSLPEPARTRSQETSQWVSTPPASEHKTDHPNVYHFIFDGFPGTLLSDAMQRAGLKDQDLDGFTYFRKNRSNYDATQASTASFMTGSLYHGGSFLDWLNAWNETGLFVRIKQDLGANIQAYSHGLYFQLTNWVQGRRMDAAGAKSTMQNVILHLALAKAAPGPVQHRLIQDGRGRFDDWAIFSKSSQDPRLDPFYVMLSDEAQRPARGQYVFLHLYAPHSPYRLDSNCDISVDATFESQAACMVHLLNQFLDELRRLARYDDSIVVVHSDHGWAVSEGITGEPVEPLAETGQPIVETDIQVNELRRSVADLDLWTSALLLIKPGGASGEPMNHSRRSTQLLDLPNTVYDLLNMTEDNLEGSSVFGKDYPESADRHVFTGIRQWDLSEGRQLWFGKDFLEGRLNHYVWQSGRGWKVLDPLPAHWDCEQLVRAKIAGSAIEVPKDLQTNRPSPTSIRLRWTPSPQPASYRLEMARDDGPFEEIGAISGVTDPSRRPLVYSIGDIAADALYRFRVRACGCGGNCSPYSVEAASPAVPALQRDLMEAAPSAAIAKPTQHSAKGT